MSVPWRPEIHGMAIPQKKVPKSNREIQTKQSQFLPRVTLWEGMIPALYHSPPTMSFPLPVHVGTASTVPWNMHNVMNIYMHMYGMQEGTFRNKI